MLTLTLDATGDAHVPWPGVSRPRFGLLLIDILVDRANHAVLGP